jgi:hypothetical protein
MVLAQMVARSLALVWERNSSHALPTDDRRPIFVIGDWIA